MGRHWWVGIVAALGAWAAPEAPSATGPVVGADAPGAIPGSYLVVDADGAVVARQMSAATAARVAADPDVALVEQDRLVAVAGGQTDPPSWGLDRIDQRALPLSGRYSYRSARGVTVYVLDTGVRLSHREFGGRARSGRDFVDSDANAGDCHGHGTHVAGVVGGHTFGVAKDVRIVSVRVLGCNGTGRLSSVVAGIDWVTRHADRPAVANLSLGAAPSLALDAAVRDAVASGVTFVVAAGNTHTNACATSPARVGEAVTVGASTEADARADFSNHGRCVDLFAPGQRIASAWRTSDRATATASGTSMAAPHVAGAAALILADHPRATPREVGRALRAGATRGVLDGPRDGSPDALLHTAGTGRVVTAALCRTATNGGNRAVRHGKPVRSRVSVGCAGSASRRSTVRVDVSHPVRGDLQLGLVAPDGTVYPLKAANTADGRPGLHRAYTLNLAREGRRGIWTLRVTDRHRGARGTLRQWTLSL
jgi:subtilisin family serine protease